MAVRSGMTQIVNDLRNLTDTALAQYQVNGVDYWTDEQLQGVLDENVFIHSDTPLTPKPMMYDGTLQVRDFYLPKSVPRTLELVVHPEPTVEIPDPDPIPQNEWRLQVVDTMGNVITTDYTYYPAQGLFRFDTDIGTSKALYIRGYGFNLYIVASKVWEMKAGHTATLVEFKAGQTTVKEQQEHQHCLNMAKLYKRKAGVRSISMFIRGYDNGKTTRTNTFSL